MNIQHSQNLALLPTQPLERARSSFSHNFIISAINVVSDLPSFSAEYDLFKQIKILDYIRTHPVAKELVMLVRNAENLKIMIGSSLSSKREAEEREHKRQLHRIRAHAPPPKPIPAKRKITDSQQ